MKVIVLSGAAFASVASFYSAVLGLLFTAALPVAFAFYGIAGSRTRGIDPLNDLPNAVRVGFGAIGGYLFAIPLGFVTVTMGALFILTGLLLNDEYQRRTLDSLESGRRGGSIAVLGIDGSGKSSHSRELVGWFSARGYLSLIHI